MNAQTSHSSQDDRLDQCGCCGPAGDRTPAPLDNPPGKAALDYRVGTHATLKDTMLRHLTRQPALEGLRDRSDDDPAVGLLDAWASVLDVLAFYQERIANEGFLGTATEPRSVRELAGTVGYRPSPGLAAGCLLAFTCEDAPTVPAVVTLEPGLTVLSLPAPAPDPGRGLPQTFETTERLEARPAWNELRARRGTPAAAGRGDTELFRPGVATDVGPGGTLLFAGDERDAGKGAVRWTVRTVAAVTPLPGLDVTRVTWERPLAASEVPAGGAEVHVLQRAAVFGHNAPDWRTMPESVQDAYRDGGTDRRTLSARAQAGRKPGVDEWPRFTVVAHGQPANTVDLDLVYPTVAPGSLVVLAAPGGAAEPYRVTGVDVAGRADFTLTGKVTRLTLDADVDERFGDVRATAVLLAGEPLELAPVPRLDPVEGQRIELAAPVPRLPAGRRLLVSGKLHPGGEADPEVSEEAEAGTPPPAATPDEPQTTLRLRAPLRHRYDRRSFRVAANVVPATHGETRQEVLGSGDTARALQSFTLQQGPLTYVRAGTAAGTASALQIQVGGVAWAEVASLNDAGPRDHVYAVSVGEDGRATVQFGDGVHGARLPTGQENVTAAYRVGTGLAGAVGAGRLTLLATRPLGVRGVTNPLPAGLAADPEDTGATRHATPRTALTLDRVVSVSDYEETARSFAGIAKALAAWRWDGQTSLVHVTVAGDGDVPVDDASRRSLERALRDAGDPFQRVRVVSRAAATFDLAARVVTDPRHETGSVHAACAAAAREAFSFERRELGQPVAHSEVAAVLQSVPGVIGVVLDALHRHGHPAARAAVLPATPAPDGSAVLLTLDPDGLTLTTTTEAGA